jgi:YesN/AraC family two-component response regulator
MNTNIISLADFKRIPSLSIFEDDVLVVRSQDIPYIPKPKYPVRIKYFVFVYCSSGSVKFSIDTKTHEINEGQFLLMSSDCVMEFHEIHNFKGTFLVVSYKYMKTLTTFCTAIWKRLATIAKEAIHDITEEEAKIVANYIERLVRYCNNDNITFRKEIIMHEILAFLHELCGFQSVVNIETTHLSNDRNKSIYGEFISLVVHNFRQEHSVSFYAEKMGLTPKYLSIAVRTASGNTPSECIQKFLIQESMVLLKNTNMAIKQIVAELNFPTATFFCRYFKRHTGMSPNEYRTKSL